MANPDANTERRMERLRRHRLEAAQGLPPSPDEQPAFAYRAPAAASSSSSGLGWIGMAACAIGGGVLLAALFKGTAPSSGSRYAKLIQQQEAAAAQMRANQPPQQQPRQFTQQRQQPSAHPFGHNPHSRTHTSATQEEREARDAEYARKWAKAKSDFARLEEMQTQARERGLRPPSHPFAYLRDHDPDFELSKNQARADFVQSKFHSLRQSKRILRYQSWGGVRSAEDTMREAEAEEAMEGESGYAFRRSYAQYKAIQWQLATQPQYVLARQLLFETGPAAAAATATADGEALASSPFISHDALEDGFLTCDDVRKAYLTRAKECHPDMPGGDHLAFQQLTDAYELLMDALEPLEKTVAASAQAPADAQPATQ